MDVALIGLPSSGKTSLLRALAAGHLPAHSNPNEPAMAVVKVPDERLDRLAALVEAKKTTYLELKILDFPSFAVGKKGPPPALLGTLATADMLVHVVHAFNAPAVPHPLDTVDPARDIAAMDLELAFADLAIVERRIDRLTAETRSLPAGQRGAQEREIALLTRIREALENETPASYPPMRTAGPDSWSQNPSPYRRSSSGTTLCGRTISATQSADTIRPANKASHRRSMSPAVE